MAIADYRNGVHNGKADTKDNITKNRMFRAKKVERSIEAAKIDIIQLELELNSILCGENTNNNEGSGSGSEGLKESFKGWTKELKDFRRKVSALELEIVESKTSKQKLLNTLDGLKLKYEKIIPNFDSLEITLTGKNLNDLIEKLNSRCRNIKLLNEKENLQDSLDVITKLLERTFASVESLAEDKQILIKRDSDLNKKIKENYSKKKELEQSKKEAIEVSKENERILGIRRKEIISEVTTSQNRIKELEKEIEIRLNRPKKKFVVVAPLPRPNYLMNSSSNSNEFSNRNKILIQKLSLTLKELSIQAGLLRHENTSLLLRIIE